jgi:CMP-N-acetylneuraminic acid synthetase
VRPASATVAAVFARGGSTGLAGKNLALLGGRSLIAWSIATALDSPLVDRVILSTDDPAIAKAGREAGAEVPWLRPARLATADSPEWLSWQHLVAWLVDHGGVGTLLSLPATSPLRALTDVHSCLDLLWSKAFDVVVTVTPAKRHPAFNMVRLTATSEALLATPPAQPLFHRQAADPLYDMTTVAYAARAEWILEAHSLFEGRVGAVVVPEERATDIDTVWDLLAARAIYAHLRDDRMEEIGEL